MRRLKLPCTPPVRRIDMHFNRPLNLLKTLPRHYSRHPFPTKLSHYLHRANLIDSIRLHLRTNPPHSLASLASNPLLDSFVATQALRSAPSAASALLLNEALESNPCFVHTQNTVHALGTVLAKSKRVDELKYLIQAVNAGRFRNVRLSFMNVMNWYAAVGDVDAVVRVWEEYRRGSEKRVCAESYNVVMRVYAEMGRDREAVRVYYRMIEEGALPNCRTYTVMIEHMVKCGKLRAALEVFIVLPFMRVKRTLRQYEVLVEACVGARQFEEVKGLLEEMQVDGMLPGRAMRVSLEKMREAGFVEESDEFLREMLPNEGIKSIGYCDDSSDDNEDMDEDEEEEDRAEKGKESSGVQLKPWLDPRSLAKALQSWSPDEVSALEEANFVWTTRLVSKILRNFKSAETAWKYFCWVACQPDFTHDIYTVQRMMALLARHGHAELVDKLLSKVRMEQMRLPFSTIRLIIDFYGLSKNADAALKVFRDDRNLCGPISNFNMMLLYSSLLRTLIKCRRDTDVLDVLEDMILSGICPDIQTFSGLMHHCALNGDIKTVQKLFAMVRQSGVQPDAYMFKVLIQAYCKCERAALAWRAFEDLRNLNLLPDTATKELLVKSLWKEGKRREAAAVEETCEETSDVLLLSLRGHIWTVSTDWPFPRGQPTTHGAIQEAYNSISIKQPASFFSE